jgi:hypothetical protein
VIQVTHRTVGFTDPAGRWLQLSNPLRQPLPDMRGQRSGRVCQGWTSGPDSSGASGGACATRSRASRTSVMPPMRSHRRLYSSSLTGAVRPGPAPHERLCLPQPDQVRPLRSAHVGSRRRGTRHSRCQPSHQRGEVPPDHPEPCTSTNERSCGASPTSSRPGATARPARVLGGRAARRRPVGRRRFPACTDLEQERAVAEVEARLGRQVLNLEAEGLPPQTRQRVIERIGELEAELARAQASLVRLRARRPQRRRTCHGARATRDLSDGPLRPQATQGTSKRHPDRWPG